MQRQDETLASVTIEPGHGATVTYRDQCSFPELEPDAELELVCGEQRMLVSRHQVWPLEGAEWPQQHLYHLPPPPLYCPPPPLYPLLPAPAQPALRHRHSGRGPALARAPLQLQSAPAAATAMGTVDGGVICGGGLQGEVQGYGKMQDTRLLVLGSSKIFKGWEEDGKQSRGGMAAGKYLWMVWHLHCWNFSDTDYFVKYTESMISILLQIALVRSQQEMV